MIEKLILDEAADKVPPKTIVLQPISDITDAVFQENLDHAIAQADAIIVDLLWIKHIDQPGITLLLNRLHEARKSGKSLSFLSMDRTIRTQLDATWAQQHEAEMSERTDIFTPGFEQFLDEYRSTN